MNITPTVTWLELGWVVLSFYIMADAIIWILQRWQSRSFLKSQQGPSMEAANLLLAIGYYAFAAATCNAIAGIAAMFTGPNLNTATQETVMTATAVAQGGLVLALVSLKIFMVAIEHHRHRLVDYFLAQEMEAVKHETDLQRLEQVASSAVLGLEEVANAQLEKEGKEPFTPIAPVEPEHHSPATEGQQHQAIYQTLMARIVAARLLLELPLMDHNGIRAQGETHER